MNKDFYRHDFECSPVECGCGGNYIDYKIVDIVQSLKDSVKREINIISGYRCEKYNNIVGISDSFHTKGQAVDLEIPEDSEKKLPAMKSNEIINLVKGLFKDVYIYAIDEYKIHIDIRSNKDPKSVKIVKNITNANLIMAHGNNFLDIANYIIMKSLTNVIDRNIDVVKNKVENFVSHSIGIQIMEDNKKNLPKMRSVELKNILEKIFGNLLYLHELDEYTLIIDSRSL